MSNYYKELLDGKYGKMLKKHSDIAGIIHRKYGIAMKVWSWSTNDIFTTIQAYLMGKKKYDGWSHRDIDKVIALIKLQS